LLFIFGGEVGNDAFIRRADFRLTAEVVQVPPFAGTRRRAVLPGTAPGNEKPTVEFALFDGLIR